MSDRAQGRPALRRRETTVRLARRPSRCPKAAAPSAASARSSPPTRHRHRLDDGAHRHQPGPLGLRPALSLSYDSGAGNGPFGFGWSLSLPAITRKTDKGLPQYQDAEDSDVFILSGAEDLVPVLVQNAQGKWERETCPRER